MAKINHMSGKIKFFNYERGFGFIVTDKLDEDGKTF